MCDCGKNEITGDALEAKPGERYFDHSADAWLLGRAVDHLHADEDDAEGQHNYRRAIELLGRCAAASETVGQVLQRVPARDVPLRWSLLYVLADVGDPKALDLFARVAAEPIRQTERDPQVCESPDDGERLVRVMAVEGLARLAGRADGVQQTLEAVIAKQSDPAVRSAAVQALRAIDPESVKRLAEMLPEDHRWMLDVRTAHIGELVAEVEAEGRKETVSQAPVHDRIVSRPRVKKECD